MWCLGLSGGYFHDAAACIFEDGKLIVYIEEERLTRVRYAENAMPQQCVAACLDEAGISLSDVDVVALSWNPQQPYGESELGPSDSFVHKLLPKERFSPLRAEVVAVDHQLAHAASAYRTCPADDALVVSADGSGDGRSMAIYRASGSKLTELSSLDFTQSLGWFFQRVTTYAGIGRWQHAGKTMALAAYGEPKYAFDFLGTDPSHGFHFSYPHGIPAHSLVEPDQEVISRFYLWQKEFLYSYFSSLGIPKGASGRRQERTSGRHVHTFPSPEVVDLAASAQRALEDCLVNAVSYYLRQQQVATVCLAGGVAMNCKAVGELLLRIPSLRHVYVPPVAGDMGGAIGAALEALSRLGVCDKFVLDHAYWGQGFDDDEIRYYLHELGLTSEELDDPSDAAAQLIAEAKTVGWFQGRMEVGARALGNRSILALPTETTTRDYINRAVKNRELWRPLSPSVIPSRLLSDGWRHGGEASPFMTLALSGLEPSSALNAVRHVDGTSRVQLVRKHANPRFYHLIQALADITGCPAVLNTSLNARDEPIACRPGDAIRVFYTTPLDALFIGRFMLRKG